jgi:hypothetical protein
MLDSLIVGQMSKSSMARDLQSSANRKRQPEGPRLLSPVTVCPLTVFGGRVCIFADPSDFALELFLFATDVTQPNHGGLRLSPDGPPSRRDLTVMQEPLQSRSRSCTSSSLWVLPKCVRYPESYGGARIFYKARTGLHRLAVHLQVRHFYSTIANPQGRGNVIHDSDQGPTN